MNSERRTYPRHAVRVNVLVSLPDSGESTTEFAVESLNLSLAGIQLACKGELIVALLKQRTLPFSCTVQFTLPDHEHRFVLGSHYLSYRRQSQHHFVMVVIFMHEDEQQKALLASLLANKL